jgi:hypothetical protein
MDDRQVKNSEKFEICGVLLDRHHPIARRRRCSAGCNRAVL